MDAHSITTDEVQRRLDAGHDIVFIDTRDGHEWASADRTLPNAIHIAAEVLPDHLEELRHEGPIVLYGAGDADTSSTRAAVILQEAGFRNVFALRGGMDAWLRSGGETTLKIEERLSPHP